MNDTPERWLPLPGYEGIYDVSDQGRVRSWAPWRSQPVPRIRSQYLRPDGHKGLALCNDGVQISAKVHQLVLLAFVGPRPEGMEIRHLDGDPINNVLSNLVYGTHSENMFDRVRHGTWTNLHKHKTHCDRGHPFDGANTWLHNGRRYCRECRKARNRADRAHRNLLQRRRRSAAKAARLAA